MFIKRCTFQIYQQYIESQYFKQSNLMQFTAYAPQIIKTHQHITKIVDGDGFFVCDMFGNNKTEIRLLGIDAPEIKKCRKLLQDEREAHLPGQLLMELGRISMQYLASIAPIDTIVSLLIEKQNSVDLYGRTLAYAIRPDGSCLNELMINAGYAKAFGKYFCHVLPEYQRLNMIAMQEKRGHYSRVNSF
ncbi:hypothetical protein FC093_20205 [Ilyomonas limi]|uniref:TNase-like domain-containing protein n=1 Tax=Ilyomonas limi TaxID=2575867 RepID=A0A4U3KWH0_9BACT|nr:thermonuclease family protein [Ilyomonas limi]TKK65436.1 hypothetical protein FC093_20205 [Ilyomonas limi]